MKSLWKRIKKQSYTILLELWWAIVFDEIQKKVTDKFGVEPMIYAFPLTHMESDWAGEIRKRVKGA
jgi:hypothetical protein